MSWKEQAHQRGLQSGIRRYWLSWKVRGLVKSQNQTFEAQESAKKSQHQTLQVQSLQTGIRQWLLWKKEQEPAKRQNQTLQQVQRSLQS